MTVDELIERLEEYRDALGGDAEVRLMTQQHWPFENAVCGIVSNAELNGHDEEEDEDVEDDRVVYIVGPWARACRLAVGRFQCRTTWRSSAVGGEHRARVRCRPTPHAFGKPAAVS